MKISIIVPIYHVEKYICKCIESICNQTYSDLEIILVDDGSDDKCGEICEQYASKDPRIQVCHIKNSGQSHARNVGLSKAIGDYIGFVDGDDWIHPDMYEKMLQAAIQYQAGIVECNFNGRKEKLPDTIEALEVIEMDGKKAIEKQLNYRIQSRYPATSVWSKLFERNIVEKLQFPDGRVHEEYAFLCEAFLKTEKYVYINENLYERTLRDDSTTAEKFSVRSLDKIAVFEERSKALKKQGELDLLQLSLEQEYILWLYDVRKAWQAGMKKETKELEKHIRSQKKQIMESNLPLKKKMLYRLFLMNPKLYYAIR